MSDPPMSIGGRGSAAAAKIWRLRERPIALNLLKQLRVGASKRSCAPSPSPTRRGGRTRRRSRRALEVRPC